MPCTRRIWADMMILKKNLANITAKHFISNTLHTVVQNVEIADDIAT